MVADSIDSIRGTIVTSKGTTIDVDIGLMAASFSAPDTEKICWRMDGLNPDFYAWRRTDDPSRVQVLIRNLNAEGGAYCFTFIPHRREDAGVIIQQLLAAHEWVRAKLIELRRS